MVMPDNQIIGINIQLFRERLGLSQDEVASYLKIKRELISYYENGNRTIPSALLNRLANLYGVDPYDLYDADSSNQTAQLAFAFRSGELPLEALDQIARFKKIVLNYLHMSKTLSDVASNH